MRFLQKINPEWPLRLGLGGMFIYSGYDLFMHPTGWYWAIYPLPQGIQNTIDSIGIDAYLQFQGILELVLAFLLLAWFLPRWTLTIASFMVILEMAFILLFVGVRADTFRDIGLLGAAIALFFFSLRTYNIWIN